MPSGNPNPAAKENEGTWQTIKEVENPGWDWFYE